MTTRFGFPGIRNKKKKRECNARGTEKERVPLFKKLQFKNEVETALLVRYSLVIMFEDSLTFGKFCMLLH